MQIQGIKIGITVIALVVGLLTVNTLSAAAGIGVSLSPSGLPTEGEVEQTAGDFSKPDVTGVGSEDPGFFGVAVGVTDTLQQLITLATGMGDLLTAWGVPAVIAGSAQVMIDLTMGIGILQILLRFAF
jgi:hypothetical protein